MDLQKRMVAGSPELAAARQYWHTHFAGGVYFTTLPADAPRKKRQQESIDIDIPPALAQRILRVSDGDPGRTWVVLAAGLTVLLNLAGGADEIVIATPAVGKITDEDGMANQMVILKIPLDPGRSFKDLMYAVHGIAREAYMHQDYPLEVLLEECGYDRREDGLSFMDVSFALEDMQDPRCLSAVRSDVAFVFSVREDGIRGRVDYHSGFLRDTMQAYIGYYLEILDSGLSRHEEPVERIKSGLRGGMPEVAEQDDGRGDRADTDTITGLFEKACIEYPERTAVIAGARELSYVEVNRRANRLSRALVRIGAEPGALVGMLLPPDDDMVICLLAILKAGCAFLPIDADNPVLRNQYVLTDSGCSLVVTKGVFPLELSFAGTIVNLDTIDLSGGKDDDAMRHVTGSDPAMVIYTSGSTGYPKGVKILHGGLCNYIRWFMQFGGCKGRRFVLNASVAFDSGYTVIFGALLYGLELHVLPKDIYSSSKLLVEYIARREIVFLKTTPSYLSVIVKEPLFDVRWLHSLELLMIGGEAIDLDVIGEVHRQCPGVRVINHYGPTETTIGCIAGYVDLSVPDIGEQVAVIGRPIDGMTAYILDKSMKPVSHCIPGDLYISGVGVSGGYLNKPDLTADRFLDNPFGRGRLYKTGDRVRRLTSGDIQFIGRNDDQVKIRGYRIELNEVEAAILRDPSIGAAAVICREESGSKYICAYVVPTDLAMAAGLKGRLKAYLPDHMVPAFIVTLDRIPLKGNGKLDRGALPDPKLSVPAVGRAIEKSELAEGVAEAWSEVLKIDRELIFADSNFFDLGGHSLQATTLVSIINRRLNLQISFLKLFRYPVFEMYVEELKQDARVWYEPIPKIEQSETCYELSHSQKRLWIVYQLEQGRTFYNRSSALYITGPLDVAAMRQAFRRVTDRHEMLRTVYVSAEGEPMQKVPDTDQGQFDFEYMDLRQHPGREERAAYIRDSEAEIPFNLESGPVCRTRLLRLEEEEYLLLFTIHHIAVDHWSIENICRDLSAYYNAALRQEIDPLPALPIQFKDFARWQNRRIVAGDYDIHRQFWLNQFPNGVQVLNLPTSYPRPAQKQMNGAVISHYLRGVGSGLNAVTRENQSTVFITLLTFYYILLHKYTGQREIVVGTTIANREREELRDQVGFYVNLLPLNNEVRAGDRFCDLHRRITANVLSVYEHQAYPFDMLAEALQVKRDPSRNAIFDVEIEMNTAFTGLNLEGLDVRPRYTNLANSLYDLQFELLVMGDDVRVNVIYSVSLFSEEWIRGLLENLESIAGQCLGDAEVRLEHIRCTVPAGIDGGGLKEQVVADGGEAADVAARGYRAPETAIEAALCAIWGAVLGAENVGVDDNFFELGGHSLKAIQIASEIQKELKVKVNLFTIFSNPTIKSLASMIRQEKESIYQGIEPAEFRDYYPLSASQERIWVASQMAADNVGYNMPAAFLLEGKLDRGVLNKVIFNIVDRHEALRTVFPVIDGVPVQLIRKGIPDFVIREIQPERPLEVSDAQALYEPEIMQAFDLVNGPLLRIWLIALPGGRYLFLLNMHHLLGDAWSSQNLIREFVLLYRSLSAGEINPLRHLRLQYKDFSEWQAKKLREDGGVHRDFWRSYLGGELPELDLFKLVDPTEAGEWNIEKYTLELEAELSDALGKLSARSNTTISITCMTVMLLLLHFYSEQNDLLIGTIFSGREHPDLSDLIGCFVNTVPFRASIYPEMRFKECLSVIRKGMEEIFEHHLYPLDRILSDLRVVRKPGKAPLFNVVIQMQDFGELGVGADQMAAGGMEIRALPWMTGRAVFDLVLTGIYHDNTLKVNINFNKGIFPPAAIGRLAAKLRRMVENLVEGEDLTVYDLCMESRTDHSMIG